MILLSPVADSPELADIACSVCQTCVTTPCVTRLDTNEDIENLLAGTLNAAPCPSCGTFVSSDWPVHIALPELGIRYLGYAPLDLLEDESVCEEMNVDGRYRHVCYSLDKLARQVRARIRFSQFQPASPQINQSP